MAKLTSSNRNTKWSENEINILVENYGDKSIESIAKRLGRTKIAVHVKAQKMGLGSFFESSSKYLTLNTLTNALGLGGSGNGYKKISWIKNKGLKTHKLKRLNMVFDVIKLDEFWEWAYGNQAFLDFSKFEKFALGPEPEWVEDKRQRDLKRSVNFVKTPWTKEEDAYLKNALKKNKYTYDELSRMFRRTTGAIQRRISDLKIKDRPVKAYNHNLWSEEEYQLLGKMIKNGDNYENMAAVIGRSSKAIRGRVFDHYLTESLDKVRKCIGDGNWGDNRPDYPLRYIKKSSPEQKEQAYDLITNFAFMIKEHAKSISGVSEKYKDFWQKDMCYHWDNLLGCLKNEAGCDSCSNFRRLQPQYCVRCGKTFFERKEAQLCSDCRVQRKKSAARKYYYLKEKGKLS